MSLVNYLRVLPTYHTCGTMLEEKREIVDLWGENAEHPFYYCPKCEVYTHRGHKSPEVKSKNPQDIADYLNECTGWNKRNRKD